jgi:biopolymer transport protein ExbD
MADQSRFHKSRQRRAERAPLTAHGNINLVPLVDILTSIVFFSLATYTGAALATLTAFDLSLPPVVVTATKPVTSAEDKGLNLVLAVKITTDKIRVEHSGGGGFVQEIPGLGPNSIAELQNVLERIRRAYPDNKDVLVVPNDDVSYDNIIKVLETAKVAGLTSISIGSRARATQVAAAGASPGAR